MSKPLTDIQIGALALMYYALERFQNGVGGNGFSKMPDEDYRKSANRLVSLGYAMRGEFKLANGDKATGWRITGTGWNFACAIDDDKWIECGNAAGLDLAKVEDPQCPSPSTEEGEQP